MRTSIVIAFSTWLVLVGSRADSATLFFNASLGATTYEFPLGHTTTAFRSAALAVQPGDVVNFGTFAFESETFCQFSGSVHCSSVMGSYDVGFNTALTEVNPSKLRFFGSCIVGPPGSGCPEQLEDIHFTNVFDVIILVPTGVSAVQIAWVLGSYSPASPPDVPLPPAAILFGSVIAGAAVLRRGRRPNWWGINI